MLAVHWGHIQQTSGGLTTVLVGHVGSLSLELVGQVVESLSVMAEKVALDCMAPVCDLGAAGTRYKTPQLEETNAMEMLRFHMQQNHVVQQVQGVQQQPDGGGGVPKVEKVPRHLEKDCLKINLFILSGCW